MPLNPKQIKDSVEGFPLTRSESPRMQEGTSSSTLLHRRHGDNKTFNLLPGSELYATPWDATTPEAGHQTFIRGPLLPSKESDDLDDDLPLLQSEEPELDTPDIKKVRFSKQESSGSTLNFDGHEEGWVEFGSVPNSANSRTEFLPPPPRSALRNRSNNSHWIPDRHPWWASYEPVHWPPLIFLSIAVLLTYPLLVLAALAARNRSLFGTRLIIGAATSILGFTLGLALMGLGKRILESATWATIVHHSRFEGRSGITLSDLEAKSDQTRFTWLGFALLIERFVNPATWRKYRRYDKRMWTPFILFFIIISLVAASIGFLLGRLVNITTAEVHQSQLYQEISIMGDLTPGDVARVTEQLAATESYVQTWTLSPYGSGGQIPQPVKLQWDGQDVFFNELSEQVLSGGLGYGTFDQDSLTNTGNTTSSDTDNASIYNSNNGLFPSGSVLRLSRWGLRIQCAKLPNPQTNLVPLSPNNITYAYVPKDIVHSLLSQLGLSHAQPAWNNTFLQGNDTVPHDIDMTDIDSVGVWWDNGVAQSFFSYPIDNGDTGAGWIELDVALIRLNTTYTPYGTFSAYSTDNKIGYDAAVCVETIEPWVVDAYNATTGRGTTFKIIGRGSLSTLESNYGQRQGHALSTNLNSTLNSVGKFDMFALAHDNSRNQILKDNARDFWWAPNPTAISWTGGNGPRNYTTLSAVYLASALGTADAAQLLPYMVGSQPVLAYQYADKTLASATVLTGPTIATCAVILLLGFAAAFLVPRLPLSIPRRDFGLFTWLAAFEGDGILHDAIKQGIDANMDLEELKRKYGEHKIRYGNT